MVGGRSCIAWEGMALTMGGVRRCGPSFAGAMNRGSRVIDGRRGMRWFHWCGGGGGFRRSEDMNGLPLLLVLTLAYFAGCAGSNDRERADKPMAARDAQSQQGRSRAAAAVKELTLDLGDKVTMKLVRIP